MSLSSLLPPPTVGAVHQPTFPWVPTEHDLTGLSWEKKAEESICGSKAPWNLFIMRSARWRVPRVSACVWVKTPWEKSFISCLSGLAGPNLWEDCRLQHLACSIVAAVEVILQPLLKVSGDDDERLWLSAPSEASSPLHPGDGRWHRAWLLHKPEIWGRGNSNFIWHEDRRNITPWCNLLYVSPGVCLLPPVEDHSIPWNVSTS